MSLTPPDSRRTSAIGCDDALSVADLATRFSNHSLHHPDSHSLFAPDYQISPFTTRPPTPPADLPSPGPLDDVPCDSLAPQAQLSYFSFNKPLRQTSWAERTRCSESAVSGRPSSSYSSMSNASLRYQRQRSVRRQCSSTHLKDIRALVAKMVSNGDLCQVHGPTPTDDESCCVRDDAENAMIMDEDDDQSDDELEPQECCAPRRTPAKSQPCAPTTSERASSCCVSKAARLHRRGRRRGAMSVY